MFISYKPHMDDPKAVLLASIVGSIALGLFVFCVVFGTGFFMFLRDDRSLDGVTYEVADTTLDTLVSEEDPIGSLLGLSAILGVSAGVALLVKDLFTFAFKR